MPWWGAKASVKAADASASSLVDFHKQATTMKSIYYEKHIHRTLLADVLFGRTSLFFVVVHYMSLFSIVRLHSESSLQYLQASLFSAAV